VTAELPTWLWVEGRPWYMHQRKARGKVGLVAWTIRNYLVALKTALVWAAD
jgi:hypothetical protein